MVSVKSPSVYTQERMIHAFANWQSAMLQLRGFIVGSFFVSLTHIWTAWANFLGPRYTPRLAPIGAQCVVFIEILVAVFNHLLHKDLCGPGSD